MNIKFYLLKMKNRTKFPIQISVSWSGNRIQKSIGISVKDGEFDTEKEKFKRNSNNEKELNSFIDNLKNEINDFFYTKKALNVNFSKIEFNNFLDNLIKPKTPSSIETPKREATIVEIVNEVLILMDKSPQFQKSTIKKYRTNVNYIKAFQNEEVRKNLFIVDIDQNMVKRYAYFLSEKKNLQDPSIHKAIKVLSTFLNKAFDYKLIPNNFHKTSFTKVLRELNLNTESQKFALSNDDIQKIINYNPAKERLAKSKDCFLFQIYSGMRHSDLLRLTKERINFDSFIMKFQQWKTGEDVLIPLIAPALEILEKYENYKLPVPKIGTYNKHIKAICEGAGLNDLIERVWKSMNRKKTLKMEKWQAISNHFGRVTFTVESLRGGALDREVMSSTGHLDSNSFEVYKKIAIPEGIENVRSALEKRFGKNS